MNGWRRVRGWGVLGCRPNTTGLRVAGGMPGKPKRIRGCYSWRGELWKWTKECVLERFET